MDEKKKKEIWEKLQKRIYPNEREKFFRDTMDEPLKKEEISTDKPK